MFVSAVLYFGLLSGSKAPLALAQTIDTPTPGPVATPQLEEWDGGGDENLAPIEGKLDPPKYANMDSNLNRIVQQVESGQFTAHAAASGAPIHSDESVAVTLYITEGYADAVVEYLEANGASPRNVGTDYIEAYVPVSLLPEASEQEGVLRIDTIVPPEPAQGAVVSEGVTVHGAKAWHDAGLKGRGVRIGIIDTGFEGFAALQGTELPASVEARCYTDMGVFTFNLADCTDSEDGESRRTHGTAVAEALFDVAPEATYFIANISSPGDLANTVQWMIDHDVDVINHSVGWTWSGPGDGTSDYDNSILSSVAAAVANGITWVNSAGNVARSTWYGDFTDTDGDRLHEFSGTDNCNNYALYVDGEIRRARFLKEVELLLQLRWDDRWGGASSDLDLFLFRWDEAAERLVPYASSTSTQSGSDSHVPYERIKITAPAGVYCLVVHHAGGASPDWIQVQDFKGLLLQHHTLDRSIGNPAESRSPGLLAVGAAPWNETGTIEGFSSRGPTQDGRVKPDIVGADRGKSVTRRTEENPDGRWTGTSQASPHVAGLAALVKQQFSDYSPRQVAAYLKNHAEARGAVPNNTWGYGFARLVASDAALPDPTGTPTPTATPIADNCFERIGAEGDVSGSWADDCESSHPDRSGRYARFYGLDLDESSEVTITLESSADPYLYLREGVGRYGTVLCANDDYGTQLSSAQCDVIDSSLASGTDAGMVVNLAEGAYTIEATTYEAAVTGEFTLTVRSEAAALPEPTPTPTPVPTPGPSPTPGPTPSPTPVPLPPDFRIEDYACNEADLAHLGTFVLSGTIGPVSIDSPGYTGVTARHNTRWVNEDNSEVISCTAIQFDSISNARWVGLDYAKQLQAFGADVDIRSQEQAFIPWIGDDLLAYRTLYRVNDVSFSSATVAFLQASTVTVSRVDYFNVHSEEYPDVAKPERVALNVATRVFPEGHVSPQGGAAWGFDAYIETFDWLE